MDLSILIVAAAIMRVIIGLAPIVAAEQTARGLGFPAEHDNPTARLMGRLFGVRDIGLGVLVFAALSGQVELGFALLFNAGIDLADASVIAVPLLRRHGIDRAARFSLVMASAGAATWLLIWTLS